MEGIIVFARIACFARTVAAIFVAGAAILSVIH